MAAGNQPSNSPRASWRGRRVRAASEGIHHEWQRGSRQDPSSRLKGREYRLRLKLGLLAALFLGGVSYLLVQLLFAPPLTPVLAITAGEYHFPIPTNAWAKEDLAALRDLHERTLKFSDVSANWDASNAEALGSFRRDLQTLAKSSHFETAIVYVSMHGVVRWQDGSANACLVPPNGSPLQASSWLSVTDLMKSLNALPSDVNKLLILDCNRINVCLDMGVLFNDFADHLADAVEQSGVPNLAVLTSTSSSGEVGWSSPELQSSVFGYYLREGLAGDADSNGNRRISTSELEAYLQARVSDWATANRAARQRPRLLRSRGAGDFNISWVTRGHPIADRTAAPSNEELASIDLESLWKRRDERRRHTLFGVLAGGVRWNPLAWREYEKKLVWLEQALASGEAYERQAIEIAARLKRQFADAPDQQKGLRGFLDTFADYGVSLPAKLPIHSLGTGRLFGEIEPTTHARAKAAFTSFQETPTLDVLRRSLAQLKELEASGELPSLAEKEFLEAVGKVGESAPWGETAKLQQLTKTRLRAELLTAPADERAVYWLRTSARSADHYRRLSEDRLMYRGVEGEGTEFSQLAEKAYDQIDPQIQGGADSPAIVIKAFAVRDQLFNDIAYLAQWYTRPALNSGERQRFQLVDGDVAKQLTSTIDAAHRLDEALARYGEPESSLREIKLALDDLTPRAASLREGFSNHCEALVDLQVIDGAAARDIETALATPLPTAIQRRELRDAVSRFQRGPADSAPDNAADITGGDADVRQYEKRWPRHFSMQLLQLEAGASPKPADGSSSPTDGSGAPDKVYQAPLARQGDLVREHLRSIPDRARRYQERLAAAADARSVWSEAERMIRHACGYWFPEVTVDPIARLREVDLQQMLIWQAERSLADFGGRQIEEGAFFEVASQDYIKSAHAILPLDGASQERLDEMNASRENAAKSGVSIAVDAQPRSSSDDDVSLSVKLTPGEDFKFDAQDQPSGGFVNVFVRSLVGDVLAATTPQPLPLENMEIPIVVPAAKLKGKGALLEAVASFRGHDYVESFEVDTFLGQKIELTPQAVAPTKITVFDRGLREKSVIFILDCSASMSATMKVDNAEKTRMQVAGDALLDMLQDLARQPGVRAGVLFFGQRVGWSTDKNQPVVPLWNPDYKRLNPVLPEGLMPSLDVEAVVDLGEFDIASLGLVARRLRGVRPWGQTPLYLSLSEALRQFANDDLDTDKSIVVISDGANNQYTPGSSLVRPKKTGVAEVRQLLQRTPVPIHIIGFGVAESERAEASQQFKQLAELSDGQTLTVDEAPDLIKSLRGLFGQGSFALEDGAGVVVGSKPLGEPLVVTPEPRDGAQFTLRVNNSITQSLDLPRGRWLQLVLSQDKRRVLAKPFDSDVVAEQHLYDAASKMRSDLLLRIHRPVRENSHARFPISIQNPAALVTAALAEAWIEITPLNAEGVAVASAYTFYDSRFLSGKPTPMLEWTATDWPDEATRAGVRLWVRREPSSPNERVPMANLLRAPREYSQWRSFEGLPAGAEYQIRTVDRPDHFRISVIERCRADGLPLPLTRVDIDSGSQIQPTRIVRRFDHKQRIATHSFWFSAADGRALRSSEQATILLTSGNAVKDGALGLAEDKPITVGVYDSEGLLPAPSLAPPAR